MKGRFKENQMKQRHKRREYSLQYKDEQLAKMTPEDKQKRVDRE